MKSRFILFFIFLQMNVFCQNTDYKLLKAFNIERNKNLDPFFLTISNSNNVVGFGTSGSMFVYGLISNDKKMLKKGGTLLSAQLISIIITQPAKRIIRRDRPFITYSDITPVVLEDGFSMPSGHTSFAFATATSLTLLYPKWYVALPSYTFASLVGYSRLHLGVHYPSDVLAGAAVGVGSAYLNQFLLKKFFAKKKTKDIAIIF